MPRQTGLNHKRIHVVAGVLLDVGNRVLITDRRSARSMQDFWEFPGGKRKAGESAEAALERELEEELGIRIRRSDHLLSLDHDYPDQAVHLDFFTVREWLGDPAGCEGQNLRWVSAGLLDREKLLPADAPVVEAINSISRR